MNYYLSDKQRDELAPQIETLLLEQYGEMRKLPDSESRFIALF